MMATVVLFANTLYPEENQCLGTALSIATSLREHLIDHLKHFRLNGLIHGQHALRSYAASYDWRTSEARASDRQDEVSTRWY